MIPYSEVEVSSKVVTLHTKSKVLILDCLLNTNTDFDDWVTVL